MDCGTAKPLEEKHQCQRCGALLEPKRDSGMTVCGLPVILVPALRLEGKTKGECQLMMKSLMVDEIDERIDRTREALRNRPRLWTSPPKPHSIHTLSWLTSWLSWNG